MKRFYSLLSFVLLSLFGLSSAYAQTYQQGELIKTVDELTSQNFCLYSTGQYGEGYLAGTGAYTSTLGDDGIFTLEATGETSADGYPLYLLKQVNTGKYFEDYELPEDAEDSSDAPPTNANGDNAAMTTDASAALKVVVLAFQTTDEANTRSFAKPGTNGEQDLNSAGFVFSRNLASNGRTQFFGHLGKAFHSIYQDTNAWQAYTISKVTGNDLLYNYMVKYYGNNTTDPTTTYPGGTAPGSYKQDLVDAAHAVYVEAMAAYNDGSLSDEAIEELCARIQSTIEALQADDAVIPMADGYYLLHNQNGRYLYSKTVSGTEFVYSANQNYTPATPITYTDINKVWKVTSIDATHIQLQNVATGSYATGEFASNSSTDDGYAYTLGDTPGSIQTVMSTNGFEFQTTATSPGNGQHRFHAKYNDGPVMAWNNAVDNNSFTFVTVSVENLESLIAEYKQQLLNEALESAYNTAKTKYDAGQVTTVTFSAGSVTNQDELFLENEGALVQATGDENASHWYSNAKSSAEGTYEALVDGDFTTYFHSDWSSAFTPSISQNHYLVATLDQPVTAPGVAIKMAKRATGNDYPTTLEFYGSNDFDATNPDAATWTDLGKCAIDWNLGDGFTSKGVGTAAVGIPAGQSYQYIKLAAIGTIFNESNAITNRGYFAISECNVWQADTYDTSTDLTPEFKEVPAAIVTELENQLAAAKAAIEAGAATQALIDALNKALDDYNNNLPDPTRVTTAYTTAKTFLDNVVNSGFVSETETLGLYPQSAVDALTAALEPYADFSEVSMSAINTAVSAINTALDAFKASLVIPTQGKYYTFKSASQKIAVSTEGGAGVMYKSIIYPTSTAVNTSNVYRFVRADGSADVTDNSDPEAFAEALASLSDTITVQDDNRTLWYIEKAEAGKIVLKNYGNGLYLAVSDGTVYQSTEPCELVLNGKGANEFRIEAGSSNGTARYVNCQLATSTLVTWQAESAEHSNDCFRFEEVSSDDVADFENFGVNAKADSWAIVTLPVKVDGSAPNGAVAYNVVGVTEDESKLVLSPIDDEIPAGTPFIMHAEEVQHAGGSNSIVSFTIVPGDDELPVYATEGLTNGVLKGTLCKADTIAANTCDIAMANSQLYLTSTTAQTIIAQDGGYIVNKALEALEFAEEGEDMLEMPKGYFTGIENAKVVVLPSVVNVYTVSGVAVRHNVKSADATKGLPAGLYIVGGHKVLVK